ncbi:uncharacterized protein LOC62_01G000177 [Vanrija pseudolonga]|uniref:Uncharacterized protein n=1 Tax=Vanrija pseudolonga TaxID=143232 RepID=A0AAF0XZ01_9TREE|nr:hypothetical protein LOC62_01G000177 [Vanrija pseudolonga]
MTWPVIPWPGFQYTYPGIECRYATDHYWPTILTGVSQNGQFNDCLRCTIDGSLNCKVGVQNSHLRTRKGKSRARLLFFYLTLATDQPFNESRLTEPVEEIDLVKAKEKIAQAYRERQYTRRRVGR